MHNLLLGGGRAIFAQSLGNCPDIGAQLCARLPVVRYTKRIDALQEFDHGRRGNNLRAIRLRETITCNA